MAEPRFPIHVHLHPHGTPDDYRGVRELVYREVDPFEVVMPETVPSLTAGLQSVSDGDTRRLQLWREADMVMNSGGIVMDPSARRLTILGGILHDTGVIVSSIHPSDSHSRTGSPRETERGSILDAGVGRFPDDFDKAVDVMRADTHTMVKVLAERDQFAANRVKPELLKITRRHQELSGLDEIPTLVEAGSMHTALPQRIAAKGYPVTVSGPSLDEVAAHSADTRNIVTVMSGGEPSREDYERALLERVLSTRITGPTTLKQNERIDSVISANPRSTWPALFRQVHTGTP